MAATDVEESVESTIAPVFNGLCNALKAFVVKKDVFDILRHYFVKVNLTNSSTWRHVTCFIALIGCESVQLRGEVFWSAPVHNTPWKWKMS